MTKWRMMTTMTGERIDFPSQSCLLLDKSHNIRPRNSNRNSVEKSSNPDFPPGASGSKCRIVNLNGLERLILIPFIGTKMELPPTGSTNSLWWCYCFLPESLRGPVTATAGSPGRSCGRSSSAGTGRRPP